MMKSLCKLYNILYNLSSNAYFGTHSPVFLFLRIPFLQRVFFGLTGEGDGDRDGDWTGAGDGVFCFFGTHSPVFLFLRVPFLQRLLNASLSAEVYDRGE